VFRVSGTIRGKAATLIWKSGAISGDQLAVLEVEAAASAAEGQPIGPVCGPYTTQKHLSDPLSAVFIMQRVFDGGAEFSGDVPEPPALEEEGDVE
jgi:hypothetical protein